MVNDQVVQMQRNEHDHYRGLHIVVINPFNGKIEFTKVFDTYKSSVGFDTFVKEASHVSYENHVPDGYIVAAACSDECTQSLSSEGKAWFREMGSTLIDLLEYRDAFAFIAVKGQGDEADEKKSIFREDPIKVSRIFKVANAEAYEEQ